MRRPAWTDIILGTGDKVYTWSEADQLCRTQAARLRYENLTDILPIQALLRPYASKLQRDLSVWSDTCMGPPTNRTCRTFEINLQNLANDVISEGRDIDFSATSYLVLCIKGTSCSE